MSTTSTILGDGTLFAYNWLNDKFTILQDRKGVDQHVTLSREGAKSLKEFLEKFLLL